MTEFRYCVKNTNVSHCSGACTYDWYCKDPLPHDASTNCIWSLKNKAHPIGATGKPGVRTSQGGQTVEWGGCNTIVTPAYDQTTCVPQPDSWQTYLKTVPVTYVLPHGSCSKDSFCTDASKTTKADCTTGNNLWHTPYCSDLRFPTQSECSAAGETWNLAACSDSSKTTKSACTAGNNGWINTKRPGDCEAQGGAMDVGARRLELGRRQGLSNALRG